MGISVRLQGPVPASTFRKFDLRKMATVGRGRGRGRGLLMVKKESSPVGKPETGAGDASSSVTPATNGCKNAVTLDDIEHVVNNLSCEPPENELKNLQQMAEVFIKDKDALMKFASAIYQKCLSDKEFARAGSIICSQSATVEVQGQKFRNCLLSLLQKDYKGREELRDSSKEKFLSFFCFLCQIFNNMKTATGDHFEALCGPIFDCMGMILDADDKNDDELENLLLQMQAIGTELERISFEKMSDLLEKVRSKIIRDGCSPRGRCTLLELIESYARKWQTMPNEVTRYYCDTMADILAGMVV
ncbi:hypothetical protein ScPMuIL_002677 [Solemya velum]